MRSVNTKTRLAWLGLALVLLASGCTQRKETKPAADLATTVRRANVVYDSATFQSGLAHVPPYVANGILGGCFDHMGFQSLPQHGNPNGRTIIGYAGHYYRHEASTRQSQTPLAYLKAQFADGSSVLNMMDAGDYRQELDIYTGTLHTRYHLYGSTDMSVFAHHSVPNLMVIHINRSSEQQGKELVLRLECETSATESEKAWKPEQPARLSFEQRQGAIRVNSSTNLASTVWWVSASCPATVEGSQVVLLLQEGENLIKLMVERPDCPAPADLEK